MTEFLSEQYWEERYLTDKTGWDNGTITPPLKAYFDQLEKKDIRILIPGCGNAHEAEYLAHLGFTNITVIDIAAQPVKRLQQIVQEHHHAAVHAIHGDFFQHKGEYDLIVEQTFFCAIDPSLRAEYVKKMYALLAPGGKLSGLLFSKVFDEPGPPFGGTVEEYLPLFSKYFTVRIMEPCYNSHPRRQGNEVFIQMVK